MAQTKPTYALLLTQDTERNAWSSDGPTLRVTASVVKLEEGKLRNPSESQWDGELGFADLQFSAHLSAGTAKTEPNARLWSSAPRYLHAYAVDLPRAEAMALTLRRLAKGEAKLAEQFGSPATFAERLPRMAAALGIKTFIVWVTPPTSGGDYDSGVWDTRDASGVVFWVQRAEADFRIAVSPIAAE